MFIVQENVGNKIKITTNKLNWSSSSKDDLKVVFISWKKDKLHFLK